MYKFLLLDLDDTIFDFHKQEKVAIQKTLSGVGIDPTEENCMLYSRINDAFWKRLERGEVTRQQVLVGRFEELFSTLGVEGNAENTAKAYMENLSQGHYFLPGAQEALIQLHKKYRLFLVSNGTASVQERRLQSGNIEKYFEKVFISQNVGVNKPAKGFFEYCFANIPGFEKSQAIIVGDSLTSDILGGKNAGIATCWVNPDGKQPRGDICPDYQISSLSQLPALLESLCVTV